MYYGSETSRAFQSTSLIYYRRLGAVIGLFVVTVGVLFALVFTPMMFDLYIPPLMFYFCGMTIAVLFQGFGLYALNHDILPAAGIACLLTALASVVAQILAIWDLVVGGPYYEIEGMILAKGFGYYSLTVSMYALFALTAGLGVILYIGQTRIENITIATGGMYLIGASFGSLGFLWPPVGFVHILMYITITLFFFTRSNVALTAPIETLDYQIDENM